MKKSYFISLFLFMGLYASAQVRYGVEAGYGFNRINAPNVTGKNNPSFRLGGFVHYSENVESGIYFGRRGMKLTDFDPQYAGQIEQLDFYNNYIEVVPFSATLSDGTLFSEKLKWFINVGFYASYGFGGTSKVTVDGKTVELNNIYKNQDFTVDNATYSYKAFKPFDCGVNFGFQFMYQDRYFLRCNLPISFRNDITPYDKKVNFVFSSLSLGYMIK
ncbi:MAG: PorT family protein [Dysgonamonadaceae bacterium]|jgi:hypothetical protein|nr:PorT family protein [Dysgonamonadaceae bacterium]